MTTPRDPELLTVLSLQFCQGIDSFVDWVFDRLHEHAPKPVQVQNSFDPDRELIAVAHSASIARNHAPIGVSAGDIFTEARKSTA